MVEDVGQKIISPTLLPSRWQITLQRWDNHKSEFVCRTLESTGPPRHPPAAMHPGVLAMVFIAKIATWIFLISTVGFMVMAALRIYQSFTGNYGREEANDDPLGSAIVYLMISAVLWILRISVKYFLEEDSN